MTLTMDQMRQNPAFERFLRAEIGKDAKGAETTVISMLARLEIDPWREAADLAAMPDAPARKRLDVLMSRFHDVPALGDDHSRIISTLLALLPRNRSIAKSNTPFKVAKLPAHILGLPLSWYIISLVIIGWITFLAQGQ